jgi:pimeloyl-ACP methyl ester carboxylesterase
MQQQSSRRQSPGRIKESPARTAALRQVPLKPRRLSLAGVDTTVLEGGDGPPLILLHGPGGHAAQWFRVAPGLMKKHRLIAPELPGHGDSVIEEGTLDREHLVSWLNELITLTCPAPPTVLGETLGGAIALTYAIQYGDRLSRLILVDSMGLSPFAPEPAFGAALHGFIQQPNEETHQALWKQCAHDIDLMQRELGERWETFERYNLELAQTPSVMEALGRLIEQFAMAPIPEDDLARIRTPVTLVWGRQDRAIPLAVGEAASRRYRWPLHVIDDSGDDVILEKPEELVRIVVGS